ncbi:hypothetical protein FM104_00670 [Microbacterium esteraromaticum]|uniref:Uncharacterized protein n=1 Tax=Microbacterium esteraromaticum TaxID=57043 RepID=A0A1R4I7V0_9MICO|nr:hypothetical protein FM104_00670 [Microbacterium esteraromaticum]
MPVPGLPEDEHMKQIPDAASSARRALLDDRVVSFLSRDRA